jgi:exopolyphosphatase/guanosine-5'-triphosphate,3'-diphosphate pyrophosphatase
VLFFDIGGGSIELVYTENYSIKKIRSLPLGAFRLTQRFGRRDGSFSKKNYARMEEYILKTLPEKRELDVSPDTIIVGVGGALRAITRYDQELVGYELDKIHNYRMDYADVSSIARELYRMEPDELASIKAIGSNRIETIVAGSTAVSLLMQKLGFDNIVVSAQGLREGILSVFSRDPRTFYHGPITTGKAKAFVTYACQPEAMPPYTATLISPLLGAGLLREMEKMILTHAIHEIDELPPSVTNLHNLFYMMIDEDSRFLTHREQLILALSIVYTRKGKTADWLFSRYRSILEPQNRKSIEKISDCLVLSNILENSNASAKVTVRSDKVDIKIIPSPRQFVPDILLSNAVKNFGEAFELKAASSIQPASPSRRGRIKLQGAAV